jgi:acyl carrier protein phosphodiesterase
MNYLAHAWLSFKEPGVLTGNMISDFVKGRKKFGFPLEIQKGMSLHRAIDEFTDAHPITKEQWFFFARLPVILRSLHGYRVRSFLANDINEFQNDEVLNVFCQSTYASLESQTVQLPQRFEQMLPYMKQQNWLYNYRFKEGIQKSFGGLVRRAAYLTESDTAYWYFNEHYDSLEFCYQSFFPLLKEFSRYKLAELSDS